MAIWHVAPLRFAPAFRALGVREPGFSIPKPQYQYFGLQYQYQYLENCSIPIPIPFFSIPIPISPKPNRRVYVFRIRNWIGNSILSFLSVPIAIMTEQSTNASEANTGDVIQLQATVEYRVNKASKSEINKFWIQERYAGRSNPWCEHIWLRYKNFDPSCFDPIRNIGMSTWR